MKLIDVIVRLLSITCIIMGIKQFIKEWREL